MRVDTRLSSSISSLIDVITDLTNALQELVRELEKKDCEINGLRHQLRLLKQDEEQT